MLQVKQTTTTLASFRSPRLISLPSTPGSPLNSGAWVPTSSSADMAVEHRAAKASTKKLRRSIGELLYGNETRASEIGPETKAAETYCGTETAVVGSPAVGKQNQHTSCRLTQAGYCGGKLAASRKFQPDFRQS